MEFVERFLGIKRRRQERILTEAGISGELRKELVGPEYEATQVVTINNDQFLKLLQSRKPEEILSNIVNRSDTHVSYNLYADIGQGVKVKTGAVQVDYSHERTLFTDMHEMGYRYETIEPKNEWSVKGWGVYITGKDSK